MLPRGIYWGRGTAPLAEQNAEVREFAGCQCGMDGVGKVLAKRLDGDGGTC